MLPNEGRNILPMIEHVFHCITDFSCQILSFIHAICPPNEQVKSWCGLYTQTRFFSPEILGAKGDADYVPLRIIEGRLR